MISRLLISLATVYLGAGFLFALLFVIRGVQEVDESAGGSSAGFRIIIFPGVTVFWPLLLKKWLRAIKEKKNQMDHE